MNYNLFCGVFFILAVATEKYGISGNHLYPNNGYNKTDYTGERLFSPSCSSFSVLIKAFLNLQE